MVVAVEGLSVVSPQWSHMPSSRRAFAHVMALH